MTVVPVQSGGPQSALRPGQLPLGLESSDSGKADAQRQLDQLISRALAYRTGGDLQALFTFVRGFPHLAPFNAMLLHVQNPGIRYALTAEQWEDRYDRKVRLGARPYVILWTMGPVAFVFDLSDTEARDPTQPRVPEGAVNPFPAKGDPPVTALPRLERCCRKIRIEIDWRDFGSNLAGRVQRHTTPGWDFLVQLNAKHTDAQRVGTLAHELAHVFCGHLGETENGFWTDRRGLELAAREFEAEAVAWLVTERLHLDIGSVSYLAGYLRPDTPLPDYSLDAVLKAPGKIEEMIRGVFRSKSAESRPKRGTGP